MSRQIGERNVYSKPAVSAYPFDRVIELQKKNNAAGPSAYIHALSVW
jgi:hypothetical protein